MVDTGNKSDILRVYCGFEQFREEIVMENTKEKPVCYGALMRVPPALIQVSGHPVKGHSFAKEGENILYSVAFRNLSAKTQVFHSNVREHLRTRLTHTLEVARIAVDMAEMLGFDTRLAEAIALGHDLGHTPFGHVGERAIHKFSAGEDRKYTTSDGQRMHMPEKMKGFKHNLQSVRLLVDYTAGCEFSNFVLYGIREHSSTVYKQLGEKGKTTFYEKYIPHCSVVLEDGHQVPAWSVEAFLVKWADEIAQRHHDIEDAYFQKIMSPTKIVQLLAPLNELSESDKWKDIYSEMQKIAKNGELISDSEREWFLHYLAEFVIGIYVSASIKEIIKSLGSILRKYQIAAPDDFARLYHDENQINDMREMLSLKDTPIGKNDKILNDGLKYAILDSYEVQRMDGRSEYIIRRLLRAYKSNPQQLPNMYINRLMKQELQEFLPEEQKNALLSEVHETLGYDVEPEKRRDWQDYECRNALRVLLKDPQSEKAISPSLMRVIFDYVSFMTDRSAYEEYKELYE